MKKEKMKKLTNNELNKELKERTPYSIMYDYMKRKINLTNEQLEKLIKLNDERGGRNEKLY